MSESSIVSKYTGVSPQQYYQQALDRGELSADPAQALAIEKLDRLFASLLAAGQRRSGWWERLRSCFAGSSQEGLRGLYLWGGVGRGKTCLMDMFFHCLPGDRKLRMHFHRFMGMVHARLAEMKGEKNPLQRIGRELAEKADVLCFDEFFVSDIGDAMLLAGLLEALFEENVVLVATSNLPPQRLYENGLQRKRFIPAIRLIEAHTEVLNVDGGHDYRLSNLEQAGLYFSPLDPSAQAGMQACFERLVAGQDWEEDGTMEVLGRSLQTRRRAEDLVWFDFAELCEGPRSAADYVEIAQEYHTVLLSGVPQMDAYRDDAARRFVALVDEFYDHGVKLVLSAAVPVNALYRGQELAFAFERTASRLTEMQGHNYLASEHRP